MEETKEKKYELMNAFQDGWNACSGRNPNNPITAQEALDQYESELDKKLVMEETVKEKQVKDIREYLHLYIGCEANVLPSEYYESGQGKIVSIDLEGEVAVISNKSTKYCVEAAFHDVEPILRRLSDMTEEEMKTYCCLRFSGIMTNIHEHEIKQIGFKYPKDTYNIISVSWEKRSGSGMSCGHSDFYFNQMDVPQFTFLLSKGFDLFGLIDSGLAIDKATLPPIKQ